MRRFLLLSCFLLVACDSPSAFTSTKKDPHVNPLNEIKAKSMSKSNGYTVSPPRTVITRPISTCKTARCAVISNFVAMSRCA
jgi:hypothetical protein